MPLDRGGYVFDWTDDVLFLVLLDVGRDIQVLVSLILDDETASVEILGYVWNLP